MVTNCTMRLDRYHLPTGSCLALIDVIAQGKACIVSNESFNSDSSVGPAGISPVVLASSIDCDIKL